MTVYLNFATEGPQLPDWDFVKNDIVKKALPQVSSKCIQLFLRMELVKGFRTIIYVIYLFLHNGSYARKTLYMVEKRVGGLQMHSAVVFGTVVACI